MIGQIYRTVPMQVYVTSMTQYHGSLKEIVVGNLMIITWVSSLVTQRASAKSGLVFLTILMLHITLLGPRKPISLKTLSTGLLIIRNINKNRSLLTVEEISMTNGRVFVQRNISDLGKLNFTLITFYRKIKIVNYGKELSYQLGYTEILVTWIIEKILFCNDWHPMPVICKFLLREASQIDFSTRNVIWTLGGRRVGNLWRFSVKNRGKFR